MFLNTKSDGILNVNQAEAIERIYGDPQATGNPYWVYRLRFSSGRVFLILNQKMCEALGDWLNQGKVVPPLGLGQGHSQSIPESLLESRIE